MVEEENNNSCSASLMLCMQSKMRMDDRPWSILSYLTALIAKQLGTSEMPMIVSGDLD